MKQIVALNRCETYDIDEVTQSLRKAVEHCGGLELTGKRVLLKPNILRDSPPEKAVTTHPEFVRAAIRICQDAGAAAIYVGDSPGVHLPNFKGTICGIRQVTEEEGALWVDFSGPKLRVSAESAVLERDFFLAGILSETDIIISLPKLKTHQLMGYTGAVKNLYGLIPGYAKAGYHVKYPDRDSMGKLIVDLNQAVRPHFAMMDGIVAMEGPGPGNGFPRSMGLVAASYSPVAMDIIVSGLIGYAWDSIPTNLHGIGALGHLNSRDEIELRGDPSDSFICSDFQRLESGQSGSFFRLLLRFSWLRSILNRLKPKPVFDHRKCIRCGECAAICASKALSFSGAGNDKRIVIQYKKCIRCYCCHEVCPADAITIM